MEKRICLMNDSFPPAIDGVANAVVNYASELRKLGQEPAVVTPFYPDADDSCFDFPVLRYPSLDLTRQVGYRAGLPFSAQLLQRLEGQQFDLIHTHCPVSSAVLARLLRSRTHAPVILTYHTKFDIDIANAIRMKLVQEEACRLLAENIAACDEVWTVSRGAGENLRKLGYQGDYLVMPNGVDFPAGRVPEQTVREVTEEACLPDGVPVYLFVGRLMWYKGIRIILDALCRLRSRGRDFRMVFIGAGGDEKEILAKTLELGLSDRTVFLGAIHDREQIRAWYCRAELFLFPSTFDTNGLVVREAAACALPSVLVAGSCAAEDITDGRNGFLIEENAASMAALLENLQKTPQRVREVGERAQKEIYLSWEQAVERADARYDAVLERFRAGQLPPHEELSDELLSAMAQLLEHHAHRRARQAALRQNLRDRFL